MLRRFNLVGYDARIHGKTKGDVPSDFRRAEAAEDVYHFMVSSMCQLCVSSKLIVPFISSKHSRYPLVMLSGFRWAHVSHCSWPSPTPIRFCLCQWSRRCRWKRLVLCHPPFVKRHSPALKPVDVAEGRTEIYECWAESQQNEDGPDEDALLDAICGALQLGFNGQRTKLIQTYGPFFSTTRRIPFDPLLCSIQHDPIDPPGRSA